MGTRKKAAAEKPTQFDELPKPILDGPGSWPNYGTFIIDDSKCAYMPDGLKPPRPPKGLKPGDQGEEASKGETITLDKTGKRGFLSKGMKDTPPPKKLANKKK